MDRQTKRILKTAKQAVGKPYPVIIASRPALDLLVRLGRLSQLKDEVSRLVALAESEPHPIRQGDALWRLAEAVRLADGQLARLLEGKAVAAWLKGTTWRSDYRLRGAAIWENQFDHGKAISIAQQINDRRFKRTALKAIGESSLFTE